MQKFDALLRAMHKANRVAVCRKVWRKNSRVTLCVLAPDVERMVSQCSLVISEHVALVPWRNPNFLWRLGLPLNRVMLC